MERPIWILVEWILFLKAGLYRIWCGVHRLGDSGVHTLRVSFCFKCMHPALGDTSAFVYLAGQLL